MRAHFSFIFLYFCVFLYDQISNVKYQISNVKYQFISMFITSECYSDIGSADLSRIKYQISIYFYVHYVGMLFRHRLCRPLPYQMSNINLFLCSLRRNSIPTSALPTSPVFSRLAIPAPPLLFSSPCGEVGWGYPPPLRGGWGVSFPFLVVPPDVIRLSSSCIFVPSLGQPRLPSNQHRTCIVSYCTLYIHSIYPVILKQTIRLKPKLNRGIHTAQKNIPE